jgi:hypothetical protein
MKEEIDAAWDEGVAPDYPVHSFDDETAEDDPANSAGFIGGEADLRPPLAKGAKEDNAEKPSTGSAADAAEQTEEGDTLDEDLITRAMDAGWTRNEVSGFNEAQLKQVLSVHDRSAPRPEPQRAVVPEPKQEEPEEEFDIGLDPEMQDPDVIKAFKNLDDRHKSRNGVLQKQLDEVTGHLRRQAVESYQQDFDSWIAQLPDGFKEHVGEGATNTMDEGGSAFKTRNQIAIAASHLTSGMAGNGQSVPNQWAMFERGLYAILGEKAATIGREQEKEKANKRGKMTTAIPTHKKTKRPDEGTGDSVARDWANGFIAREGLGSITPDYTGDGLEGI